MNFRHLRVPLQLSLVASLASSLVSSQALAQTDADEPPATDSAPPSETAPEADKPAADAPREESDAWNKPDADDGSGFGDEPATTPSADEGHAAPALSSASVAGDAAPAEPEAEPEAESGAKTGGETDTSGIPPELADRLVMPKLQRFQDAPYPEEALADGVQGSVVLSLTVSPEGTVTEAEIQEPAGYGFDEAAQAAALQFLFAPATLDGNPIPVKILYRYDFTLEEIEDDPDLPTTGEVDGKVTIAQLDSTIVGATVVATSTEGETYETVTDEAGQWKLVELPPGDYIVTVTADGFEVGQFAVNVAANEGISLEQELYPKGNTADVIVRGVRPPRSMTKRTLTTREMSRIPGTGGDALRALQSMPGVARAPGMAGLLIIRGSSPRDSMTFINGMTAPLIYHFGGLSSVIPTELIEEIDFYPGNFSAKYGRVMGGIVDVKMRSPNTQCTGEYGELTDEYGCFRGLLEVDMIQGRFMFQGPLDADNDWTFAVAARRSWVDLWLGPVLDSLDAGVTQAPVYDDFQVIVETEPTPTSKLALRFLGSSDVFEMLIDEPAAQDPGFAGELTFGTAFLRGQVEYEAKLSDTTDVTTFFSVGRTKIDFGIGGLAEFDLLVYPVEFRSEFGVDLFQGARLNLGVDFLALPYDSFVRAAAPPRPGEPRRGPFSAQPVRETAEQGTHFRPGLYAEAEVTPLSGLRVVPGVRFDYYTDTDHSDVSPRVNASYDIVPGGTDANGDVSDKTTLKAGVGVYTQPPTFQETDRVFGTPGILSNRSIHYSAGIEQEIAQIVDVDVEGFYKEITALVSREPTTEGERYNNNGIGSIIGLETLIKYQTDERFFGWVAYTLSKSVRQNSPEEEEYYFQFDQTHNLTMLGSYRLGRGWELGARFRVVSGNLTTPVVSEGLKSVYASDVGVYTPIQGEFFSERLPLFHELDIRIDKRWQFRTWRLSAYLDVRNVYNNAAKEAIVYNFDFTESSYQLGLPILPSIGLRGEF